MHASTKRQDQIPDPYQQNNRQWSQVAAGAPTTLVDAAAATPVDAAATTSGRT